MEEQAALEVAEAKGVQKGLEQWEKIGIERGQKLGREQGVVQLICFLH